ncbi:MAG: hypothetical protein ACT4QC_06635, partial [Planctomycetaceae bacterium]
ELHATRDETKAKENVLERFGNPATIALKLWSDAMWEKIMSQRMMLAALVVVMLASAGSTGLTWVLFREAQQATEAMLAQSRAANEALAAASRAANESLIEQNQKTNEALLARLAALGPAGDSAKSMEWNPVKVRLVSERLGTPASGFEVKLSGSLLDTGKSMTLRRTTGADGIADFGLVRPGGHHVHVTTPWGESSDGRYVTVLPGEGQTVEMHCPPPLEEADIALSIDWPKDLGDHGLWFVCDFIRPAREFAGQVWTCFGDQGRQFVAVDPAGKLFNFNRTTFLESSEKQSRRWSSRRNAQPAFNEDEFFNGVETASPRFGIYRLVLGPPPSRHPVIGLPDLARLSRLRWPAGSYRIGSIVVGQESDANPKPLFPSNMLQLQLQYLDGIALHSDDGDHALVTVLPKQWGFGRRASRRDGSGVPPAEWVDTPKMTAIAGRLNEWRLSPPDPLVELVREALVEQSSKPAAGNN